MSWDKNIKNYYDTKKKVTKTINEEADFHSLIDSLMEDMSDILNESWQNSRKWQVIKEDEEGPTKGATIKDAKKFVAILPKFAPSEAWGDPTSMERQQVQKIFDMVGGDATVEGKMAYLRQSITNPSQGITSARRIISTLIILESLSAILRSFNEASAGFVFEGFIAALLRGSQVSGRSEKGNLPIQDLIAFDQIDSKRGPTPISLKLLSQATDIEGSYTNLIDGLDEFGQMIYIVARKDGEEMVLEQFELNKNNFINAIITAAKGNKMTKEAELLKLPGRDAEQSIAILNAMDPQDWPKKYELLKQTAGYRAYKPAVDKDKQKDPFSNALIRRVLADPQKQPETLQKLMRAKLSDEEFEKWDSLPDDETGKYNKDMLVGLKLDKRETQMTVSENRRRWKEMEERIMEVSINEGRLDESKGGSQWAISPSQLGSIEGIDYKILGELPYSTDRVVKIAESYMDNLSANLEVIFQSVQNLSTNVNEYFTLEKRSEAFKKGNDAKTNAENAASALEGEIEQEKANPDVIEK